MKVFENYADQSNSHVEYERLRKLQEGINKDAVRRRYSDGEIKGMQGRNAKFEGDLKRNGRAQPLRAEDTKLDRGRKKISKINAVTNIASQVNWSEDGLYFIVFLVSVIGDVGTAAIGVAESSTGGLIAVVLGVQMEMFVLMISVTVMVLYILNGHYKKRRAVIKIAVLMGFTFTELMPIVTALPGFVGSFIINYAMVLYDRSMQEALARDSKLGKVYRYVTKERGVTKKALE